MAEQIEVILFDLGKVIVDFDTMRIAREVSRRSGATREDIVRLISSSSLYHDFEKGNIAPVDFLAAIESQLSFTIPYAEFLPVWNDIFTLKPEMETYVRQMKRKYRIAALSNTNELHWAFLKEKFDIMRIFDDLFLSCELHCRKPEEEIYKKALDRYKLPPGRIAYIDDVPAFVAVACGLGIQGYVFKSVEDLKEQFIG
jgi:HAD superfamily hydrolase (TIGR01509 family)